MKVRTQLILAIALFCCGLQLTTSQCFSDDDDLSKSTSTDLSGITDFSLTLFKELFPYNQTRNFFFSPYSIWSALALSYFGSGGHTEQQLQKALGVNNKIETLKKWRALEFMYKMRQLNNSDYIFKVANRAYFDKSVRLNRCIEDILSNEVKVVDFRQPANVSAEINEWVANITKGRITNLVTPGDLAHANMVLTNAAFFKGSWSSQFKRSATKKDLFYTSVEEFSFVEMMNQKGNFRNGISEELGAHVVELPYVGNAVSMIILLPPFILGDQGFGAMIGRLNASTLHQAIGHMWRSQIQISIPKFSLSESVGDELMSALGRMGVTDLFDRSLANLTGFSTDGNLSVGRSIHKAFVEVSEEGTEAAAATALISFRSSRPLSPLSFKCNHPFLFIIRDNLSDNILFMGAYKSPKK